MPWSEKKQQELAAFDAKVASMWPRLTQRNIAMRLGCSATKVRDAVERLKATAPADDGATQ